MQIAIVLSTLALSAQVAPPKPAIPKPAAVKQSVPSGVDAIIALVKGGMSESLVIKTIVRSGKPYSLTPNDMLKLQKAGVSENIIQAMLDPTSVAATSTPPPAAMAPVSEAVQSVAATASTAASALPASIPNANKGPRKRRLAVMPFDHAAVATWVQYWFHADVNVGQGIRAMLTTRMHKAKSVVLLERARLDAIEKELKLNNTSMVNQGTKAKMGKISGADCMLLGDIVVFGRDDRSERSRASASTYGSIFRRVPVVGRSAGSIGQFKKEEKAVVAIALRIVDTETGEVLETAEARGESSRSSKNWDVFASGGGNSGAMSNDMSSSNFQATIIGEAASDAVDKIIAYLDEKVPQLPIRSRTIEGRVAKISGSNLILSIGGNDGVEVGDRFDILKIISEVLDPDTKEVLDVEAVKVGEMVAGNVREKITTGQYGGQPVSENYAKGYTARLVVQ